MASLLLVTTTLQRLRMHQPAYRRLGIATDAALLAGTTLTLYRANGSVETYSLTGSNNLPNGVIHNLLRQYDAVCVLGDAYLAGQRADTYTLNWVQFNPCPPILYHRITLTTQSLNATGITPPADFPIRIVDASNLPDSAFTDAVRLQTHTTAGANPFRVACLRVRFLRENKEAYLPAWHLPQASAWDHTPVWLYRLDLAKHEALGSDGEILAVPVEEDLTFPDDTFVAYRYKHAYFLPNTPSLTVFGSSYWQHIEPRFNFWTLYGLKLAGIPAPNPLVLLFCIDDALTVPSSTAYIPTYADWGKVAYTTYEYLAHFYRRTGCPTVCGLFTGGRYNRASEPSSAVLQTHWDLVMRHRRWTGSGWVSLDSTTQQWIQRWHQLLLREHTAGLPCTIHDHTIRHRQNRVWATFTRHDDTGNPYAAPNDLPKRRAPRYVRAVGDTPPPGAVRIRGIDGQEYDALYPTDSTRANYFTGTGTTLTDLEMRSYHGARIAWESAVAEMRALGFPDAHGGERNRLIISPNYLLGGPMVWQILQEIGYRAARVFVPVTHQTVPTGEEDRTMVPFSGRFQDLRFFHSLSFDIGSATGGTAGLYSPSGSDHAVAALGLDTGNDISGIWDTDRERAAQRAFRRMIGWLSQLWLICGAGYSLPVFHPPSLTCASTNDPLARFDEESATLRFNLLVELFENMAVLQSLVSDYVRWGPVAGALQARETYGD